MKKVITYIVAGILSASVLYATNESHNLSANMIFKIGSKTYNGTTSGVLNVSSDPSPSPSPSPTPTYSHVFPRADDPALNGDATIQDIVNVLNQNAASANATFYVVGNSWAIRCNEGYEWLESQDPAWGGDSGAGQSINRGVAKADWDGGDNEYRADSGTMNNTYNGMPDMGSNADRFVAGCWPINP